MKEYKDDKSYDPRSVKGVDLYDIVEDAKNVAYDILLNEKNINVSSSSDPTDKSLDDIIDFYKSDPLRMLFLKHEYAFQSKEKFQIMIRATNNNKQYFARFSIDPKLEPYFVDKYRLKVLD